MKAEEAEAAEETPRENYFLLWLTAAVIFTAIAAIYIYVPTEKTEGAVQRIMYFHIPCAWLSFFAFFVVFLCSILFLWKKDREWDIYAQASAEIGVIFCSLVLITGPIWARPIWGGLVGLGCAFDLDAHPLADLRRLSHAPVAN